MKLITTQKDTVYTEDPIDHRFSIISLKGNVAFDTPKEKPYPSITFSGPFDIYQCDESDILCEYYYEGLDDFSGET